MLLRVGESRVSQEHQARPEDTGNRASSTWMVVLG